MRRALTGVTLSVAAALALAPAASAATEYFASPDEARTGQDCLTRQKACALGVAVTKPTSGDDTVTVLSGSYDLADINAGAAPGSEPGQLELIAGTTLAGDPDGAMPTISSSALGAAPTVDLTRNTLRWLRIERQGASGAAVSGVGGPANPAFLDRVIVTSSGEFGVALGGTAVLRHAFVIHTGSAGAAIRLDASARPSNANPQPRLLAVTARSAVDALRVVADGADAQEATVTNSAFAGAVQLSATATSGTPGTLTLKGDRSAYPAGSPSSVGPVSQIQAGSIVFADSMLTPDGLPSDGSPLIDGGLDAPGLGPVDLAGRARLVGASPDIGALERQDRPRPVASPTPAADPGFGTASDPLDAFGSERDTLQPWLEVLSKVSRLPRSKLAKGQTITVTSDEPVTAKLELLIKTKRKGKTTERAIGTVTIKTTAAGEIRLKLKVAKARVPKAGTKATLRFTLTDLAGNVTTEQRTTKLT